MSADKYPCIFSRQMATIVYIWMARKRQRAIDRFAKNFGTSLFQPQSNLPGTYKEAKHILSTTPGGKISDLSRVRGGGGFKRSRSPFTKSQRGYFYCFHLY